MKTLKLRFTGIRPLILHNGLMADPTNEWVMANKKITAKKNKKTDTDCLDIAYNEWMGSLYMGTDGGLVMPTDNIERCLQDGGKKSRIGKDIQAGVFCDAAQEIKIEHPEIDGKSLGELYNDERGRFILRKGVKVQLSRVIRVRPLIPAGWVLNVSLEYDEGLVSERNLIQAAHDAGASCGLGDWRPKYGRFSVEVIG